MGRVGKQSGWFALIMLITTAVWGGKAYSQEESAAATENLRYQLGKRVRRYELLWEASNKVSRAASTDAMEFAVQQFFRLDLAGAAKSIDDAWLAMVPSPTALQRNAAPMSLSASSPLLDASEPVIFLTLNAVYPQLDGDWNSSAIVQIELNPVLKTANSKRQFKEVSLQSLPTKLEWRLDLLEPGDYQLSATIRQEGAIASMVGTQISIVKDKQSRLKAISAWIEENKRGAKTSSLCTARMFGRQLLLADRGKDFECDLPMSNWFREFESIAFATPVDRPIDSSGRWQVLSDGKVEQVVRIQMPTKPVARTKLLFAFHGAGGSENMFFEAYGAGRLVELAKQRNWVVVCPRQGLTGLSISAGAMIPMLESDLGLSFDRVFYVGHSMGAGQAIEQVSKSQERIEAVAAIGGGGNPRGSEAMKKIPFFVSAGERDFGRGRASQLCESLRTFECKVEYSEYQDVEHLTIVQACLDDLFRFLDQR